MNTQDKAAPSNFIRNIIDADIAAGKHGGRVATRFPPEPNGYLHVGHAKSICLNFGIARDYKGTCNLRFDDTNPHKENIEYVEAIKQDVRWLGYDWDERLYYASDYFEQLHDYAVQLIRKGKAYVCDLTPEQTREYRGTLTEPGKDSPYRESSIDENLDLFARMRAGEFEDVVAPAFELDAFFSQHAGPRDVRAWFTFVSSRPVASSGGLSSSRQ